MMDGRSIRVSGGSDRFQRTILGAWPAAYGPETAREAWEAVGSYDDAESYRERMGEMPDWGWLVVAKMGCSWYIDLIDLEL